MVTALILSGGTGTRMGGPVPKQYLDVNGKPVLLYCLEKVERQPEIDAVIIVATENWHPVIRGWIAGAGYRKVMALVPAGDSRQHSVYRGLQKMKELGAADEDIVIVHDGVRPCVSSGILRSCVTVLDDGEADGAVPVIAVKDTVYQSSDGKRIEGLLARDQLYAGQTPESFRFGKYYRIHQAMTPEELHAVRGSSEIACRGGMNIHMFRGSEENYKITTRSDLERFRCYIEAGEKM